MFQALFCCTFLVLALLSVCGLECQKSEAKSENGNCGKRLSNEDAASPFRRKFS